MQGSEFRSDRRFAEQCDRADPLREFRSRFHIPRTAGGEHVIYFCGNSLGLQPRNASDHISEVLDAWRDRAVEGHFHGEYPWWTYHDDLAASMARLVGALPSEVTVMNALTVNLHMLMASFYRPTKDRYRILIERPAFPSDRYAVVSQIAWHGYDPDRALLEIGPPAGEDCLKIGEIESLIAIEGNTIALVLLGGVNYYTGQVLPMERITYAARSRGCRVGFDLAHAVGNVPLALHDWGPDFAVWCTYKYLNGGPGATGGCFVHDRHAQGFALPRLAGWWGNDRATRFEMRPEHHPIPGAEGWQISNLPVLQLAALRPALEVFDRAGFGRILQKSRFLTGYLDYLLRANLSGTCRIITPQEPGERGSQISIRVGTSGKKVLDALLTRGVVCDWREPDVIRVAPVPLYNTFTEVHEFVERLRDVLPT
jgi:kynureninase